MSQILDFLKSQIGKDSSSSPSPLMRWLNPTMLKVDTGTLEFSYKIREEMTNPMKILHGGTTAAIIDDMLGATIFTLGRTHAYTTVNLAVDYFSTAKVGDTIIGVSAIIKQGDKIINAQCEVWNEDKTRLIARGYSNLIKTAIEYK